MTGKNIAASVRQRLYEKAKQNRIDVQFNFTRYALERLLYRLSISPYRDAFLLKGALLFDLWFDLPFRPTRDIDLLSYGVSEIPYLTKVFKDLCGIQVDDGITFDDGSVRAEEIREIAYYPGIRVTLNGAIDRAHCPIQVDIGFGDSVTPDPDDRFYPVMLDEMPAPNLRVYPIYTVVAEKLEAIVVFGMANSRLKDYFDLWTIFRYKNLDKELLLKAFNETLRSRRTQKPIGLPLGLSDSFFMNQSAALLWNSFLDRNHLGADTLENTVLELRQKLEFLFVE